MLWDKSDGALEFADNAKATFGASDLSIYHDGTNSIIHNTTGDLIFEDTGGNLIFRPKTGEDGIKVYADGAVELFHNNVKKIATTTNGVQVDNGKIEIFTEDNPAVFQLHREDSSITTDDVIGRVNFTGRDSGGVGTERLGAVIRSVAAAAWDTGQTTGYSASNIDFHTQDNSGTDTIAAGPRMRIDSSGNVGIGADNPTAFSASANNLVVSDTSSNGGITIVNGTSAIGSIFFADGTSANSRGRIRYQHSDDSLILATAETTALTISSAQAATFAGKITANATGTGLHLVSTSTESNLLLQNDARTWKIVNYDYGTGADNLGFHDGSGDRLIISHTTGNATFGGTVSDSKGNLRSIPENARGTTYTLVATDAGKCVTQTHSSGFTINNSVFSSGDAVTMINGTGSDFTITQGSGVTLYNTADASTGNRTLASRGMATVWFQSASVGYISGAGLS